MASSPILAATQRPANGQMVMVGCKHPNGLILNLDSYARTNEQGGIQRTFGKMTVTLKGWARKINDPDHTQGGYALTEVPLDFWNQWLERNRNSSLLVDKIILPPHADAVAQAVDHAAVPMMHAPARENDARAPGLRLDKAAA